MDTIILSCITEFSKMLETLYGIKSMIKPEQDVKGLIVQPESVIDPDSVHPIAAQLIKQCSVEIDNIATMLNVLKGSCKGCGGQCSPPICEAGISLPSETLHVCKGTCADCDC